jgi:hypothetical protein
MISLPITASRHFRYSAIMSGGRLVGALLLRLRDEVRQSQGHVLR